VCVYDLVSGELISITIADAGNEFVPILIGLKSLTRKPGVNGPMKSRMRGLYLSSPEVFAQCSNTQWKQEEACTAQCNRNCLSVFRPVHALLISSSNSIQEWHLRAQE